MDLIEAFPQLRLLSLTILVCVKLDTQNEPVHLSITLFGVIAGNVFFLNITIVRTTKLKIESKLPICIGESRQMKS